MNQKAFWKFFVIWKFFISKRFKLKCLILNYNFGAPIMNFSLVSAINRVDLNTYSCNTASIFPKKLACIHFFLIYRIRQNHVWSDRRKMMPDPPDYRIRFSGLQFLIRNTISCILTLNYVEVPVVIVVVCEIGFCKSLRFKVYQFWKNPFWMFVISSLDLSSNFVSTPPLKRIRISKQNCIS